MINNKVQQRINIDLNALKNVTCPNCANCIFNSSLSLFKKLPSIQSPTGKAQLIQVPLLTCSTCNCSFIIKDTELLSANLKEDAYDA